MANFNKAFNFRGGFQVDTDVLVVRGQNVGIGSSIPGERLVVDGIIQANGLDIRSTEDVRLERAEAGILTVTDTLDVGIETGSNLPYPDGSPQVRITTGIITAANPAIGVVTYYGDGGRLLNLPTSQWLDIDVGLGFTSIYAQGYVGVNTDDPRYVFQVGGVPFAPKAGFLTSQTGVGIETGSIYASDNVAVGKTITAGLDFVGVGSLITDLNAGALKYGTIGSDRFGDINAGILSASEIRSPLFIGSTIIGTATTAIGVQTTSQLVFDTGVANELRAIDRFISTEGKLQIGSDQDNQTGSSIGQVDVFSFDSESYIYSVSENNSSHMYVGHERRLGAQRSYGGLRFGGSPSDPQSSTDNDLDVINYDIGNVNHYLHAGTGGINATTGQFQWIYGQSDGILASLDRFGKLTLTGNTLGEETLEVVGVSTLKDNVFVDGDLSVEGNTTLNSDLTVAGLLNIEGGISAGNLDFAGANFEGDVTVNGGIDDGTGVGLGSDGKVEATNEINVVSAGSTVVSLKSDGTVTAESTIQTNTNVVAGVQVSAPTLNADTTITGPSNFTVDSTGLSVDSINATAVNIDSVSTPSINATDITVSNQLIHSSGSVTLDVDGVTASGVDATSVSATTVTATTVDAINLEGDTSSLGAASASSINAGSATIGDLTITNSANFSDVSATGTISADTVTTTDLSADNATIGDLNVTGTANISVADIDTISSLEIDNDLDVNGVLTASTANLTDINTDNLGATSASIDSLVATTLETSSLNAADTSTPIQVSVASSLTVVPPLSVDELLIRGTSLELSENSENIRLDLSLTDDNDPSAGATLNIYIRVDSSNEYSVSLPMVLNTVAPPGP